MFEQCDDNNTEADDGWSPTCQIEDEYECLNEEPYSYWYNPEWGDSVRTPDEEWDDGNDEENDGCTEWEIDRGYSCEGGGRNSNDQWEIKCGDGVILDKDLKFWDDNNTRR